MTLSKMFCVRGRKFSDTILLSSEGIQYNVLNMYLYSDKIEAYYFLQEVGESTYTILKGIVVR